MRHKADDFTLLASFGRVAYVLCCRANLPQANLADVLALRGKGGTPLSIGNIGPGPLIQIMSLDFEKTSGLTLTHVPYRGVPPMIQDAMGGQLDLAFVPLAGHTVATLEQGKLRALGISTTRRSPMFPQLPTLAAGHRSFERFDCDVWGGLLVRRETPADVQQRLHAVWAEIAREPGFLAWSRSTGSDPMPMPPLAETQAQYPREVARYTALLRAFPNAVTN